MSAYRKFSDVRQTQASALAPPEPAKAPKLDPIDAETFGGLGALGAAGPQTRNSAQPISSSDCALPTWAAAEAERAAIVERDGAIPRIGIPEIPDEPLLLRDGRRLWRFSQAQDCTPDRAAALIDQAYWCGAVLVADGCELIVVERWLLPIETLCELRRCASGVISVLQQRSRAPCHLNTPREDR